MHRGYTGKSQAGTIGESMVTDPWKGFRIRYPLEDYDDTECGLPSIHRLPHMS